MNWILEKIKEYTTNTAIIYDDVYYSYSDLFVKIAEFELIIKQELKAGEVVVLQSEYSFESIALFFALYSNKNIIVPITTNNSEEINEKLAVSYFDVVVKLSNGKLVINQNPLICEKHELIKKVQQKNHAGLLLFSSGSTGTPKTMIHDLDVLIDSFKDRKSKVYNFLVFLMFDHIGGLNTLFNCISMGAIMTIPLNRDPSYIVSLIEKYKINILPSTPTFLNLISFSDSFKGKELGSLKLVTYGTEPMPESLLERLRIIFPKAKFLQTFGTSETGIAKITSKSSSSTLMKIEDPDLEYKIVNNELWLKSKTQILGYLNASMEKFTEDGWFITGDLVETTEDGYLRIIGRNSEMINVGGQKVMPQEVEATILQLADVLDCIVYGESNAITGQVVVVDIAIANGCDKNTIKQQIRRHCKDKLDSYKNPIKYNFIESTEYSSRFKKIRKK